MSDLTSVLQETRLFPPTSDDRSRVRSMAEYEAMAAAAAADLPGYWAAVAEELSWSQPWDEVLSGGFPEVEWFRGGRTNLAVNCLDRHLRGDRRNRVAIRWHGEPGDTRSLTYFELHREVCRFANVLTELGVKAGEFVIIYLPMVPEAAIAMLACARLGAPHSVVFGGFSAEALAERIRDSGAKTVLTADGGWRRGAIVPLKQNVDHALAHVSVERVVVLRRTGNEIDWTPGRDHDWQELVKQASPRHQPASFDAEHPLFSLYTSGTTGKPKGILHTTGGYMVAAYQSMRLVFDLRDEDTFWCTADIGWITGHTYVVYGPLLNGTTTVMYEGGPLYPEPDRMWSIAEAEGVSIFYTAPTAIRALMQKGDEWPARHDLSALRLLGTVGEPINPEAWMWYRKVIGGDRCAIVDTWWQTETGSIMIAPLPGATPTKPGSATRPLPGVIADVVDRSGKRCAADHGGFLVIRQPWPSMARTIHGDHERFVKTYFSDIAGMYFAGDGARRDRDDYFWILGRVDDVINVAGHRLSTMEIESALVAHPLIAEAAVVGRPDVIKGQAIIAFVTPMQEVAWDEALVAALKQNVVDQIGALARPEEIRPAAALPKTRSGKIMRRLLRDLASGAAAQGDTSTLEDANVLATLAAAYGDEE